MGRLLAGLACASLVACASHHHSDGDAGVTYASIRVAPDQLAVNVALGATLTQDYAVFGTDDAGEHDITTDCILTIDERFGGFNAATLTIAPHGGEAQVLATCGAQTATATLAVNLVGTVIGPGAPANSDQLFGSATAGTDPTRTPIDRVPDRSGGRAAQPAADRGPVDDGRQRPVPRHADVDLRRARRLHDRSAERRSPTPTGTRSRAPPSATRSTSPSRASRRPRRR